MRLGGPVFGEFASPDEWVEAHRKAGYGAAYCPLDWHSDSATRQAYREAAEKAGLVIAEVGAWSNPLSRDEDERKQSLEHCQQQLALADEVGARCCVNIAGSLGKEWAWPYAEDLAPETFDLVVESVRSIIDAVKPVRTFYTLETMPWMLPYSTETYFELLQAIDRPQFAVHFDPVNLVYSPPRFFRNGEMMAKFIDQLGPYIKSCHLKDIALEERFMVHLNEVRPGLGKLDYPTLLKQLEPLGDLPLMLEHLETPEEYDEAAAYVRSQAEVAGITLQTLDPLA